MRSRRGQVAVVAGLVLLLAGALGAAAAFERHLAGASPCPAAALRISYGGASASGNATVIRYELRNVSGTACRLSGHPQLRVIDNQGQEVPVASVPGGRPEPFVLQPGGRARFSMSWENAPAGESTACAAGAELLVTLPGAGRPLVVAGFSPGLALCHGATFDVGPLQPG